MVSQPTIAFRVSDRTTVANFLISAAHFTPHLQDTNGSPEIITLLDDDGVPVVLIDDAVLDPTPYLAEALVVFQPGNTISLQSSDLESERVRLASFGYTTPTLTQTSWGDRILSVQGPDDYIVAFVQRPQRTPEEWLELYARGPQALDEALAGLTEEELDARPSASEWSIRQLIIHVAEGDALWAMPLKVALAKPGARYRQDWYTPDNAWADLLDYAHRQIEPSLALFRATRAHATELVRHLGTEVVWDRSVLYTWPGQEEPYPIPVSQIIQSQAIHALTHADEIREFRQLHSKTPSLSQGSPFLRDISE